MNGSASDRWTVASGLLVLVSGVAAVVFERGAPPDGSPEDLATFYLENGDALQAQSLLFLLGAGFFLVFAWGLSGFLARSEGAPGGPSALLFGAAVAWTAVSAAAQAFQAGVSRGAADGIDPALVDSMTALFLAANLLVAVMLGAAALASFDGGSLPRWLGWLAVAGAVANLLPLAAVVVEEGPLGSDGWLAIIVPYPLFVVWLAGALVVLARESGRAGASETEPAAARKRGGGYG